MNAAHVPPLRVYLDENVPHSLYGYLAQRQIAVITAQGEQTTGDYRADEVALALGRAPESFPEEP